MISFEGGACELGARSEIFTFFVPIDSGLELGVQTGHWGSFGTFASGFRR